MADKKTSAKVSAAPAAASSGFTKEEELLLNDFSRNVSTKSSALFYGNAFIVSAIPICFVILISVFVASLADEEVAIWWGVVLIWLFWRIHMMELLPSLVFFVVITGLSTYLMAMAYRNTKFALKHKVSIKREEAVTREMEKLLKDDKKMSRKEKDERTLWKKNEVADYEATTFSIFYNNALFLAIIIFASFYLLRTTSPFVNYIFSVSGAGGLLALLSTSKPT